MGTLDVNLGEWVRHLRTIAQPVMSEHFVARTEVERLLDAVVGGQEVLHLREEGHIAAMDEPLWLAAADQERSISSAVPSQQSVPMFDQGVFRAIEVWTECELSSLHALWRIARTRRRDDLFDWCRHLRDWHLDSTQPDNATNRPWALHVFLLGRSPACVHYAQTLLHNAMAMEARPTPLCARILLDAANEIELAQDSKW